FVLSEDGRILIGPTGAQDEPSPISSLAQQLSHAATHWGLATWPDGKQYVTAARHSRPYGRSPGTKWIAVARPPVTIAFAASHELRTPLTPLLLVAQYLETKSLPDEIRADIQVIRRNAELEARLIDDLLDLTRIARGKLELRHEPLDVHTVIDHALGICRQDI